MCVCVCLTGSLFLKKVDLSTSMIIRLVIVGMTIEKGQIMNVQFPPRPLFKQEKSAQSGVKIFCNS